MAFELRNNSGTLWFNDKKTDETSPNYRGRCKVNGKEYWVSLWRKESQNGRVYLSLSFKPVDEVDQRDPRTEDVSQDQGELPF